MKNVIIIMTDQQQATSLPMYGNPVVQTPNLSSFAEQGILFKNGFTSCPLCVPARVSLFTGQVPSMHGSLDNNILMAPGKEHLLKIVKDAGYATGLAGKNHCFQSDDMALFDRYDPCGHYGPRTDDRKYLEPKDYLENHPTRKAAWGYRVNPYPPEQLGTAWTTDRAMEFVQDNEDNPFFLWFSIPDPHIPFQACEPYASMYPPDKVDLPPFKEGEMETKPRAQQIDRSVMAGEQVDEKTLRGIRSIYYGMNTYIDTELGRFFSLLDKLALTDNTLVVYVSDHGEYLGEHKMIRKSKAAYDCLTHVPFMLRVPGAKPAVLNEFVSLEDVMPTVLDFLDLPIPDNVQGRSLLPLVEEKPFDDRPFAYGEYGAQTGPVDKNTPVVKCESPLSPDFSPTNKLGGHGKMRFIRTAEWKLVTYVKDSYELYDLKNDLYELENLYGRPGTEAITNQLKDMLIEHVMAISNPDARSDSVS